MILRDQRGRFLAWPLAPLACFPLDPCETDHSAGVDGVDGDPPGAGSSASWATPSV